MARGTVVETTIPDEPEEDEVLIDPEEPEEPEPGPSEEDLAVEAEARRQGWRPLSEFRGEPGTFKSAKDFLEAGKNFAPFVRAESERTRRENAALKTELLGLRSEMTEVKKLAEGFRDSALKAEQRGYDRAMAEVKARQRQAAAEGNVEAYDAAAADEQALAADRPAPVEKPNGKVENPQPKPQGEIDPDIQAFVDDNPWFMRDATLNNYMREVYGSITNTIPGLSTPQALQRAKNTVMQRFPEKFGLEAGWKPPAANGQQPPPAPPQPPRRRAASVVDPSTGEGAPAPRGREVLTFNSIEDPTERAGAIRAYNQQKRHMPDFTEEQFMRLYNNPRADVLDGIQRKRKTAAQRATAE